MGEGNPVPIVISHNPAQLIGDLAQNAGDFATQQALAAENYPYQALQQQGAQAAAHERLQRDMQERGFEQQRDLEGIRAQDAADREAEQFNQRQVLLQQQFQMAGQNQMNLQGARGQNQADMQGQRFDQQGKLLDKRLEHQDQWQKDRNWLRYYDINSRIALGYDRLDDVDQRSQAGIEARRDMNLQRQAGSDQRLVAQLRQRQELFLATHPDAQAQRKDAEAKMRTIHREHAMLAERINGRDVYNLDDKTVGDMRARMTELEKQYQDAAGAHQNVMDFATQQGGQMGPPPLPQPAAPQFTPPGTGLQTMPPANGDTGFNFDPTLPSNANMPYLRSNRQPVPQVGDAPSYLNSGGPGTGGGGLINPTSMFDQDVVESQPSQETSMGEITDTIARLKAEGMHPDLIKEHLMRTYDFDFGDGSANA